MATTVGYNESNVSTTLPDWYTNLYQNLLTQGQNIANQNPAYGGQLTAGFTPYQNQAGQMLQSQLNAWQPTFQGGLNQITQSTTYNPATQQQFLNPYIGGVVNEIARLGNQNLTQNVLPAIADQYTSLGQFGSARQGRALALAGAEAQQNISGQQANALANSYNQAAGQYGNWANLGLQGGQARIGAAGSGQQYGGTDVQSLFGYGVQQQQTQQNQLNAQYQEFLRQQQIPLQNYTAWGGLFGQGKLPTTASTTGTTGSFKNGGLIGLKAMPTSDLISTGRRAIMGNVRGKRPLNFRSGGVVEYGPDDPGWKISPEVQEERDVQRRTLLGRELLANPGDLALEAEVANEMAQGKDVPLSAPDEEEPPAMLASADAPVTDAADSPIQQIMKERMQIVSDLFGQKRDLADRIRNDPNLQPLPQPEWQENLSQSLFEGTAVPTRSIGELIGNVGAAYYSNKDELAKENALRAKTALGLEEQLQDKISTAMAGMGTGGTGVKTINLGDGRVRVFYPDGSSKVLEAQPFIKTINERASKENAAFMENVKDVSAEEWRRIQQEDFAMRRARYAKAFGMDPTDLPPMSPSAVAPSGRLDSGAKEGDPAYVYGPGSKAREEHSADEDSKAIAANRSQAERAESTLSALNKLTMLLKNIDTGSTAPFRKSVMGYAQDIGDFFGQNWKMEGLSQMEAFEKISSQLTLAAQYIGDSRGLSGNMSNADREFLQKIVPQLSTSKRGNLLIIEYMRRVAQRQQDIAIEMERYWEQGRGLKGWVEHRKKWVDNNNLFSDTDRAQAKTMAMIPSEIKPESDVRARKKEEPKSIDFKDL